jgi:integrase
MSLEIDEKLDHILQDLELIKNQLKIVPNREITIDNGKSSIEDYEKFAKELKLDEKTITNHLSTISRFLAHSKGVIDINSVKEFLDSNDSLSWKSNQIKALRKYIRDFLKLGNWIDEFKFSKSNAEIRTVPTDEDLVKFLQLLPKQTQVIALVLVTSGLRIGEVLSLRFVNIANELNMIDVSKVHEGDTKHSWLSFVTQQTIEILYEYLREINFDYEDESKLFSNSSRVVQNNFEQASEKIGFKLKPHTLRMVFTEKCTLSGIKDKYINAFCGRVSKSVLAKNYTDYSPTSLKREYEKVESLLTFES